MPVLPGPPAIDVALKRSARAKRFSLRVSRVDGKVTLTLPPRGREADALRFLHDHEQWLREAVTRLGAFAPQTPAPGTQIPIEGQMLTIESGPGRSIRIQDDRLILPGDPQQAAPRIAAFLRVLARDRLARASSHYAGLVGRDYSRLSLRDTRSRWGSCTWDGALMYSWRLIMAPPSVLNYVAAHEVAHLVQMNHSPQFWAVVEKIYPGWQSQRDWLKREGQTLHSYRFGD